MSANNGFALQERLLSKGEAIPWQAGMALHGWYPITVNRDPDHGAIAVCWRDLGQLRFSDSFFNNTLERQPREQRRVCHTPLSALDDIDDSLPPTAFIFHVSRCGSTLLTQLLASLPQCVVMSEPPVIDSVLRLHHDHPGQDTPALLRKVIRALGQRRSIAEKKFFIKFDCWHIHSLALLQQAFPETPCLFLYREPQAVLASHQRQRGPQMVPGLIHPALLPLPPHAIGLGDLDAYAGLVLASFFAAAKNHAGAGKLKLINYNQLPGILFSALLDDLAVEYTQEQLQTMRQRSGFHSKYTGNAFQGDPPAAQADRLSIIAASIQPLYAELAHPHY
ncbi:sulfotransferase family protein [Janthinobacterium agaricidamnosum]|uniref:Aspartyl/asparaginyl beta-hydroxylase n=1 Tax=Janthinobacterium agaricidamnosum NBRC 102515 = DSM 9628 TaxID=1349767 RepID=W0V9W2_9BURK|nr:sulfotransferase family protein [Janthinobacterium agaricidamnosum]CDG84047.1 aspartyl/asparaginyl beta-hydroxylase [Janthinobacterium agaricidamnosum NBRC 102515 = DSM 9628]